MFQEYISRLLFSHASVGVNLNKNVFYVTNLFVLDNILKRLSALQNEEKEREKKKISYFVDEKDSFCLFLFFLWIKKIAISGNCACFAGKHATPVTFIILINRKMGFFLSFSDNLVINFLKTVAYAVLIFFPFYVIYYKSKIILIC